VRAVGKKRTADHPRERGIPENYKGDPVWGGGLVFGGGRGERSSRGKNSFIRRAVKKTKFKPGAFPESGPNACSRIKRTIRRIPSPETRDPSPFS